MPVDNAADLSGSAEKNVPGSEVHVDKIVTRHHFGATGNFSYLV